MTPEEQEEYLNRRDAANRRYRETHKEEIAEYNRKSYEAHKEQKAKWAKDRRARLKAQGLCTTCGRNPATPNGTKCYACALKLSEAHYGKRYKDLSEEQKAVRRAKGKELYAKRKAEGVCTMCGARPPEAGHLLCKDCIKLNSERGKRTRLKQKEKSDDERRA